MIQPFLERAADYLIEKHNGDFKDVMIIVPTRRARLFLLKILQSKLAKTFWSPQFFILPEFVQWLSAMRIGSELELSIGLYHVYKTHLNGQEKFDEFMKWSSIAMKDFHDVDISLADSSQVFSDLRNIREIEGWSFNSEHLTPSQTDYLKFWEELGLLCNEYRRWQEKNHCWSYGSLTRMLCEDESGIFQSVADKPVYFIGMASFSKSECVLISKLHNCEVLWDLDHYYVDDDLHEAGRAIRQFGITPSTKWIVDDMATAAKKFVIHESSTSVSQILIVANLLKELNENELNSACVVLADESMMEPLISILSDIKVPVNLAIGVPISRSKISRWILAVLKIRSEEKKTGKGIYHRDFAQYIYLTKELGISVDDCDQVLQKAKREVWIYLNEKNIQEARREYPGLAASIDLISAKTDNFSCIRMLRELLSSLETNDEMLSVALIKILGVLVELDELIKSNSFLNDEEALFCLYNVISLQVRVHYQGEPANGLQVLGMVETRSLDFETVFVLGANEDTLPGNSIDQSFIPLDLRAHYNLSMPTEKESMYAYTFYRLIQKSRNIHLFYSTISSDFKGTEKSRYIAQIESELSAINSNVSIEYSSVRTQQPISSSQSVLNDDFCKQRLDVLMAEGISPSAINKSIKCSLDFYYRYIVGLGEEEEVEEQMSSATFGSIIHYVLEKFYVDFIGSYPGAADYAALRIGLDAKLREALEKEYAVQNVKSGYNALALIVAQNMLDRFIRYEEGRIAGPNFATSNTRVRGIEVVMNRSIDVAKYGWQKPVVVKGKADRIDEEDGVVEILDYKTGRVKDEEVKLDTDLSKVFSDSGKSKQLQLLSYIYMFLGESNNATDVKAGFYSFINHGGGVKYLHCASDEIDEVIINGFEEELMNWVKSMYSLEKFEHNPSSKYCTYCRLNGQ